MINVIIIDDDQQCRKALKNAITVSAQKITVVAECASADDAKRAIGTLHPQLIFLDVEMPGKNGFDLLNELYEIDFDIIFTTAFERYAIQAIKASALDFLLKPVTEKELAEALLRFETKKNKLQTLRQVEVLLENYAHDRNANKTVVVPTNNGLEFIPIDQIIRLEAESNYTTFLFADHTKLMVAKTLKEMEELLPEQLFYRVHNSHLINIDFVKRFQKNDGGILIMADKSCIPVSRHRKEEFLEFIKRK